MVEGGEVGRVAHARYVRGVYLVEGGEVGRVDLIAAVDVTRAEEGLLALVRVRVRVRVRLGLGLGLGLDFEGRRPPLGPSVSSSIRLYK